MTYLLPYFVVRHAAASLDRDGVPPSRFLVALAGIGSLALVGMLAIVAFVLAWTGLALAGVVT